MNKKNEEVKIYQIGNKVIRKKSLDISFPLEEDKKLIIDKLKSATEEIPNLVGISAPQIGFSERVIVSRLRPTKFRKINKEEMKVFINPKILEFSKEIESDFEGCGSVADGNLFSKVPRSKDIVLEYYTENGKKKTENFSGLMARIIQHEVDHLDGIIFLDRIENNNTLMSGEEYLKYKEKMLKENKKGRVVVFAGPSGSGKDTIMSKIIENSNNIVKLTTATTRKPRDGEVDGENYYFLSKDEFLNGVNDGLIPEHNIHAFNYYGTYLPDLEKKLKDGKTIFSQIQLVGAKYLKENYDALLLFFTADSFEILEKRIRDRSELSDKEIKKRIEIAKVEVEEESKFYDYIVKNEQGKLDETVEKVLKILKDNKIKI